MIYGDDNNVWRNAFRRDLLATAREGTNGTVRTVSRSLSEVYEEATASNHSYFRSENLLWRLRVLLSVVLLG